MKILVILSVMYLCLVHEPKNIRFVHHGSELKPVGTILISVGDEMQPTDRGEIDKVYGKGVTASYRTFLIIDGFLNDNKFLTKDSKGVSDSEEFYVVINSRGEKRYLAQKNIYPFFGKLRSLLERENADKKVIDVLAMF